MAAKRRRRPAAPRRQRKESRLVAAAKEKRRKKREAKQPPAPKKDPGGNLHYRFSYRAKKGFRDKLKEAKSRGREVSVTAWFVYVKYYREKEIREDEDAYVDLYRGERRQASVFLIGRGFDSIFDAVELDERVEWTQIFTHLELTVWQ